MEKERWMGGPGGRGEGCVRVCVGRKGAGTLQALHLHLLMATGESQSATKFTGRSPVYTPKMPCKPILNRGPTALGIALGCWAGNGEVLQPEREAFAERAGARRREKEGLVAWPSRPSRPIESPYGVGFVAGFWLSRSAVASLWRC